VTTMSLRLMHLANHGGKNIGNAALIEGAERVLREDLPTDVTFAPEPWDLYSRRLRRFDQDFVGRVNREADGLLVGGAVSFDGSSLYANAGFRLDLPLELWDRIERPIVFYALSYRSWPNWTYHHVDALRATLAHLLADERVLFSVRNDGTKEFLERLTGLRSESVHVVPDPGLFVPVEDAFHPELEPGLTNVIVAPNAEDEIQRYARDGRALRRLRPGRDLRGWLPVSSSGEWRERRGRALSGLSAALARLAGERELNVVFCAHDVFDVGLCQELFWLLPEEVRHRCVFASASLSNTRGRYFFDLYAKADLAISMRIHSMNPAVGLGTPVVPIVSQDRMRTFMANAGLQDLAVELHDDSLAESVHRAASAALADPSALRERLLETRARLRAQTAAFGALVATHLGAA
jgi:hypothetical protein